MPAPVQDFVSELGRQLFAAGAFWLALGLIVLVAFVAVAVRRGWIKVSDPVPAPRMPDVVPDDPSRPDATWGENVKPNDTPDAGGGG